MQRPRWSVVAREALLATPAVALAWLLFTRFDRVALRFRVATVFAADALWATLLLVAFLGWGSALNRVLFPKDRADAGLRLAWGTAIAIFAGGLLVRVHAFGRSSILGFTVVGLALVCGDVALATREAARDFRPRWRSLVEHRAYWLAIGFLFALASIQFVASSRDPTWNIYDDSQAYAGLAKEMFEASTLDQPFSMRRLGALGGQSVLHAFLLPVVPPNSQLNLLDRGMALIVLFLLLVGARREMRAVPRILMIVPVVFLLGLPPIRINTTSGLTGAALFLALWRTMEWKPLDTVGSRRNAVLLGLVAAAVCTLRQNFMGTAVLTLALSYLAMIVRGGLARPLRERLPDLGEGLATFACLVLFLFPWLSLSWMSSHTFLFPIMRGNLNPAYPSLHAPDMTVWGEVRFFWANVVNDTAVSLFPLVLLAGLFLKDDGRRRSLPSFLVASFIGFALLVHTFTLAPTGDVARYYYAFEVAAVFAVLLHSMRRAAEDASLAAKAPALLAIFACLAQLYETRRSIIGGYSDFFVKIDDGLDDKSRPTEPMNAAYAELQAAVPPGERILVMVNEPLRFDFRRNTVYSVDIAGAVSPRAAMPLSSGEALARYLEGEHIRYIAYVDTAKAWLYQRELCANIAKGSKESIHQLQAPFCLEAIDAFEALGRTRAHVAQAGDMTMVDLATRTDTPDRQP